MKTNELIGAQLDYWVARADPSREKMRWEKHGPDWIGFSRIGSSPEFACWIATDAVTLHDRAVLRDKFLGAIFYEPSRNWSSAGPIIEREHIVLQPLVDGWEAAMPVESWPLEMDGWQTPRIQGSTPLVAAMRAYVMSKFGDEVPDETGSAA